VLGGKAREDCRWLGLLLMLLLLKHHRGLLCRERVIVVPKEGWKELLWRLGKRREREFMVSPKVWLIRLKEREELSLRDWEMKFGRHYIYSN
jgi:hypothetical protein